MRYDVIVIGAGMVGTSIAWHLQQHGSQVLLIDKKLPGSETSYGNAGLIQREAIHLHPCPRSLSEILRILPNSQPDIRYRWRALWRYRGALWQYWQCSAPDKVAQIERQWQTLIAHCTDEHQRMIEAANAHSLVRKVGWIALHRRVDQLKAALDLADQAAKIGVAYQALSVEALQALEPCAKFAAFVGGIHWQNSWQVTHPGKLVKAYAASFEQGGGAVATDSVTQLTHKPKGWQIHTQQGAQYTGEHVVIAAGPWSAQLIQPLGYDVPLFPMRGYHQHFESTKLNNINHSLVDMDKGFVMGPMQQGIRVTTGAEMTLMTAKKRVQQLNTVLRYAKDILALERPVEAQPWCGSRPCLPDMKPIIGPATSHPNLWFAFGHGHQGFTLGPITGRIIEALIHQKPLPIDITPFHAQRFMTQ